LSIWARRVDLREARVTSDVPAPGKSAIGKRIARLAPGKLAHLEAPGALAMNPRQSGVTNTPVSFAAPKSSNQTSGLSMILADHTCSVFWRVLMRARGAQRGTPLNALKSQRQLTNRAHFPAEIST
jgi:hypothetical protein